MAHLPAGFDGLRVDEPAPSAPVSVNVKSTDSSAPLSPPPFFFSFSGCALSTVRYFLTNSLTTCEPIRNNPRRLASHPAGGIHARPVVPQLGDALSIAWPVLVREAVRAEWPARAAHGRPRALRQRADREHRHDIPARGEVLRGGDPFGDQNNNNNNNRATWGRRREDRRAMNMPGRDENHHHQQQEEEDRGLYSTSLPSGRG